VGLPQRLTFRPEIPRSAAVLAWVRDGKLSPTLTTPGGHHRFDLDDVRRQLRELRQRDE
jgi:hypothetical protein